MSSSIENLSGWVASANGTERTEREAIHTLLHAIASNAELSAMFALKGGQLMRLMHSSPRYTRDLDFSNADELVDGDEIRVNELLGVELGVASSLLGYSTECVVQSVKINPLRGNRFRAMKVRIGFASLGSRQMHALRRGQAANVLEVDFSFNESIPDDHIIVLEGGGELRVYGLKTLVAEKYRALLQQVVRKRNRRQDVFDLDFLLRAYPDLREPHTMKLVRSFIETKCAERDIAVAADSFENPEIRRLAAQDYDTLQVELSAGEFLDFDITWTNVSANFCNVFQSD